MSFLFTVISIFFGTFLSRKLTPSNGFVQDLLVSDDGNGQDYLCALRVVSARQSGEGQKSVNFNQLPQSARSCCVRPSSLTQGRDSLLATAKWNEVFVFEMAQQVHFEVSMK